MSDETEAFKEGAKAAQEIAKTAGNVIDATRGAGGWLDRIFGGAIEDTVARVWTDRIKASRIAAAIYDWEKLISLLHKVEARLRVMGIEATRVPPPKVVLPLLEHATLENEDDLHTLWANLLTSGLDPSEEEIERTCVSVLAELSGRDGDVLRKMFAEWSYWEKEKEIAKETSDRYSSGVGWTLKHDETSVVKFYRLGIILPVNIEVEEYRDRAYIDRSVSWREEDYVESGEKAGVLGDLQVVAFTEFGERFCKAVIGDVTGVYKPPDWVKAK